MDPGKKNFAWVAFQAGKVLKSGWVKPLDSVNEDTEFVNDFIELLLEVNPDYLFLERFMVRNRGQSVYAEVINQMIGRITVLSRTVLNKEVRQFTAAQWKNWWQKQKGLNWEDVYSTLDSVHKRDAAGIAHYASEEWMPKNVER